MKDRLIMKKVVVVNMIDSVNIVFKYSQKKCNTKTNIIVEGLP